MIKTLRIWTLILGVFVLVGCPGRPGGGILTPNVPAKLTVRVMNGGTGQPVAGARVSLKKDSMPVAADLPTGSDGSAIFSVTTGDGYKAFAGNIAGLSPAASPSIKLVGDQEVIIQMLPSVNQGSGLVAGSVKDGTTQAPLAGVNVSMSPAGSVVQQRVPRGNLQQMRVGRPFMIQQAGSSVQTDAAGQFTFNEVPPGSYTVSFQYGNQAAVTRSIVVNPGESTAIETVFLGAGGTGTNPNPGTNPGPSNPATQGHVLIVESGRAVQLNPQAQVAWSYQSSGMSCATRLADGNTVISDEQNNQVSIIGPGGQVVWNMGSSIGLISRLSAPSWIGAARDGRSFLITDTGNNRVLEIENTVAGWSYSALNRPRSATYTPTGNILIADTGNNRVIEVDRAGQIVWNFAQNMQAPVHAVRLEDGNTLITDAGFNRVIMINPQAQPVWYYDGNESGAPLNRPRSAIVSRFNTYLISDTGNNRVIEVDRSKQTLSSIPNLARPQVIERL